MSLTHGPLDPATLDCLESVYRAAAKRSDEPMQVFPDPPWEDEFRELAARTMSDLFERQAAARRLRAGTPEYEEAAETSFARSAKRLRAACHLRPTKLQDPITYMSLSALAEGIDQAATSLGFDGVRLPILGALPTGRLNAMSVLLATGTHAILFETGLMVFANLITKVAVLALDFKSVGPKGVSISLVSAAKAWTPSNEALQRFVDLMRATVIRGRPDTAQQYFLAGERQLVADALRNGLEMFVMGHELGHAYLGHLQSAVPVGLALDDRESTKVRYTWEREHEADRFGLRVAIAALRREDARLVLCAAELFFRAIDLVERCRFLLVRGRLWDNDDEDLASSHPPHTNRQQRLREIFYAAYKDQPVEATSNLCDMVATRTEELWKASLPHWYEAHRDGTRPKRAWR
jgi:hypothetical protein